MISAGLWRAAFANRRHAGRFFYSSNKQFPYSPSSFQSNPTFETFQPINDTSTFTPIDYPLIGSNDDEEQEKERKQENKGDDGEDQCYDIIIIGGGSGGIALALEAHSLGLKTVIFDYVEPTQRGTRWGIGGTCVNVGCIPKKLFHSAALLREAIKRKSEDFGLQTCNLDQEDRNTTRNQFKWSHFVTNVQSYLGGLNLSYEAQLINKNIPYVNAMATISSDGSTVFYSSDKQELVEAIKTQNFSKLQENQCSVKGKYIVIAAGGRPRFLSGLGQLSITSDDIFSLRKAPGKTLIIGGGYVALECAGFLAHLGFNTTVISRGNYLRDFDQDMVQMIIEDLRSSAGVRFINKSLPFSIEKDQLSGKLRVCYKQIAEDVESCEIYDTVLQAIGRQPNTSLLNLEAVGVKTDFKSSKILGYGGIDDSEIQKEAEQSTVSNIFALGDVLQGVPELTPPAQMAGRKLAHRLSQRLNNLPINSSLYMDYNNIATTVFTPLEYSCVGLSEEAAINKYGEKEIEVYHSRFTALEDQLSFIYDNSGQIVKKKGYCKVICQKESNKIVGLHYIGPNAGEVMQGYAVAFRMGITKSQLDSAVGIHPTSAEEFLNLRVTKSSGEPFDKDSC